MKTVKERLVAALQLPMQETLAFYKTAFRGLTEEQVEENRDLYGENIITKEVIKDFVEAGALF